MHLPNLESAIIDAGTSAVHRYHTISNGKSESSLPEIFLGDFIASHLYDSFHCPIHIERLYTRMAAELNIPITEEMVHLMGGRRADLAIYQADVPSHIVEFKIFDEGTQCAQVVADLEKARRLANLRPVGVVLGAMICAPSKSNLTSRIGRLQSELGSGLKSGGAQLSADGSWEWCFGCYSWGNI